MRTIALIVYLFSVSVQAADFGLPDTEKLPEVSQWTFALGEWQVTTQYLDEQGKLQNAPEKATVIYQVLKDGITLQSQFIIKDRFYSTQLISYNKERKLWISHFVNSMRQRWTTVESRWVNGQMISLVPRGFSDEAKFMQRSVDTPVNDGHYTKRIDRSFDLGLTWKEGVFLMDFRRIHNVSERS